MFTVNKNPSNRDLHTFGWSLLVGGGIVGAILWGSQWWSTTGISLRQWTGHWTQFLAVGLWIVAVVVWAVAFGWPRAARPLYVGWMTLAVGMGTVASTVLLTILFLLFLPIFSLVVRRADPLRKKLGSPSYWEPYAPYEPTLERMRRLF